MEGHKEYRIVNRDTGNVLESHNYFSDTAARIEQLNKMFKKDKFYYICNTCSN